MEQQHLYYQQQQFHYQNHQMNGGLTNTPQQPYGQQHPQQQQQQQGFVQHPQQPQQNTAYQKPVSPPSYGYNQSQYQQPPPPPQNQFDQKHVQPPPSGFSHQQQTSHQQQNQQQQQQQPPPNLQYANTMPPQQNFAYNQPQQQMPQNLYQKSAAPPSQSYGFNQHPPPQQQNLSYQKSVQPPPSYGFSPQQQQQQPQQPQQRLDPDSMPSVVQVIEDDKSKYENSEVLLTTSIPANTPPLVTTMNHFDNAIVNDGGCARPNFLRSTLYQIPISEDTLKTTQVPLGIVVQPFDDAEVEGKMSVPVTESEIIRCNRCKAYMNPYVRFIDGGHRFQCSLCHHISEVNQTYFCNLDHTGQRLDKFHRPELFLGSYEFTATAEYCRNGVPNARRPHIIFACELTATSKPILQVLADNLPDIIRNCLPTDPLTSGSLPPLIGFLTYNSKIQLYDIVNNGHAHVICDVASTFPPLTSFLADPIEHFEQIENFFKSLPNLYLDEELETQTVLGPVVEAALQTCQVDKGNWLFEPPKVEKADSQTSTGNSIPSGKIYLFHCTLPTFGTDGETPGRLKPRWTTSPDEVRKLLGTDKEKTILTPDVSKYYTGLGQRCVSDFASGVELFLFPPRNGPYLDVATLGELTKLTGTGAVYKYFNDFSDRFLIDLKYSLKSSFAFDAIMKVRTSTGIRPVEHLGYFYARTTSDIECAVVNTGSSVAVELKYDDKLPEDEFVVVQVAVLYTSISGTRRVRIHNMAFSPCLQIADIYRHACCDTSINLLSRQVISALRSGEKTAQQAKEILLARVINILTAYRKHCAQPGSSLGQLILPEAMKLLPMYLCGLLKCDGIDGGCEMTPDDKAYSQVVMLGASISTSQVILYPRLLRITYEDQTETCSLLTTTQIRCSSLRLNGENVLAYLLENWFYMMLFIPNTPFPQQKRFLSSIFGPNVDSIQKIQPEMELPELLTPESQFLHQFFENVEKERRRSMRIFVIRQGIDKLESIFRGFLYEDKKMYNTVAGDNSKGLEGPSYVDLLCHLHKEIRAQLN